MLGFDLAHVVMNCENAEQAEQSASKIESIFGFEKNDAGTSISTAGIIHFMKSRSYGKNGQIAVSSNFIDRAVFHLKESGKQFIDESARFNNKGELTSIYLDSLIGGFALKLVPKK
jgi:2-dehydro-3-deoxyphosphogluconate aldolase/(4S)-4-hydroxy-2-oxoglutarate aldolase